MTETTQFPRYPYLAMLITGVMHAVLGITGFLVACITIGKINAQEEFILFKYANIFFTRRILSGAVFCSIFVILVGVLGIVAGLKSPSTYGRKLAYMIMSILSAVLISTSGIGLFAASGLYLHAISLIPRGLFETSNSLHIGSYVAAVAMSIEFVLSIVSSSICCCCAETRTQPVGIIMNQQPQVQVHTTQTNQAIGYPPQPYYPSPQPANTPQYPPYPQEMGYPTQGKV